MSVCHISAAICESERVYVFMIKNRKKRKMKTHEVEEEKEEKNVNKLLLLCHRLFLSLLFFFCYRSESVVF